MCCHGATVLNVVAAVELLLVVSVTLIAVTVGAQKSDGTNSCWPQAACNTCPDCCFDFLTDQTTCDSCVLERCASKFSGASLLISNGCNMQDSCDSPTQTWSLPQIGNLILDSNTKSTLTQGQMLFNINDRYDFTGTTRRINFDLLTGTRIMILE